MGIVESRRACLTYADKRSPAKQDLVEAVGVTALSAVK